MRGCYLAAAFAAAAVSATAADPAGPRADLERLEALLSRAVDRVSRPAAFPVLAAGSCRGYRVPGVGAVFVLPPRSLGAGRSVFVLRSDDGTPLASRGRLERRPRGRARASDPHEQQMRIIEAQVQAFQREAERSRLDAEAALAELEHEIRTRLVAPAVPEAPAAPAIPAAPAAPPVPPPWRYWFQAAEEEEAREPTAIVADVRAALTAAIEAGGASLLGLRSEELVVTAVDFVAGPGLGPAERADRTLVLRVRKRDLEERQAGKLGAEELRKRIEYSEY